MRAFVLASCVVASMGANASAQLFDFASRNDSFDWNGAGFMLGYEFNVNSSITVDGLGLFDFQGNGLADRHEVGLWTAAGGLVASTLVGPGSSGAVPSFSGLGDWVFADISPVVLTPGDYVLGALYTDTQTDILVWDANGIFSNDAAASWTELRFLGSSTFQMPTDTGPEADRYFGPNLRLVVPAPGGLALLALSGVVIRHRRRRE